MPWVTIDDEKGNPEECLLLVDRDIEFVFKGEEVPEEKTTLIMPKDKKLIVS
jgi:hypothetical protein